MSDYWESVTEYTIDAFPPDHIDHGTWQLTVTWRAKNRWAITQRGGSHCLTKVGKNFRWEWESLPSNRTKAFKRRARFDYDTALRLAREYLPTMIINGRTAAEQTQRRAEQETE